MHPAQQLHQLQETDLGLAAIEQRLLQIAQCLGETDELRAARQEVVDTEGEVSRWQVILRDRDLEVSSINSKLSESQDQLYGGRVRNPKELKGLEAELHSLQRRKQAVEEAQLEAMVEIEQLEAALADRRDVLAQVLSSWQVVQEGLHAEQAELQRRRSQLRAVREQQAADARDSLPLYEDLRKRRAGRPVALLKGGVCTACGMELPTAEAQQARISQRLSLCPTCGRVLWAV